ncbi:VTT domain-containing protein [Reichenbachiella agarivorans]|uniref:TVP38/TMEM64 family membrane protein n=1 Tax=Reichenbachiella agarivorans TaxID=2979464 RepID=A0ABY6CSW1_9BACT|nr:VTT domain-containing protein [Reichenbachiella agarivorans]UXP33612.1 VTT domain-containing protein [Reichenbachiella agarivorans]
MNTTFDRLRQSRFWLLFERNKTIAILMLWMAVVPITASLVITYFLVTLEGLIVSFGWWEWGLFYLGTALTMSLAITPTTFIALLSGYFLGMESLVAVILAYEMASVVGYYLAKWLDRDFIKQLVIQYPKAAGYIDNVTHKQFMTTVLARLSPALPFALMNVVLSTSNIRFWTFFWAGLLGMLPRTVLFVWIGSQAQFLQDAIHHDQSVLWSVTASVVVMYAMYRMIKPSRQNTD